MGLNLVGNGDNDQTKLVHQFLPHSPKDLIDFLWRVSVVVNNAVGLHFFPVLL